MIPMGLLNIFRSRPVIRQPGELAQFIDENSAFLVQKGIYEYSRARAGHYSKVLFAEPAFTQALERSRWGAYPLGLAMVGELVEGVQRPAAGSDLGRHRAALQALVLSVFDRYPVPAVMDERSWGHSRAELTTRLQQISLHPPKRALDIPEPFAKVYFDLMPVHRSLRTAEFPTLHNYLKVTMCNIHDELTKRLDAEAMADALRTYAS